MARYARPLAAWACVLAALAVGAAARRDALPGDARRARSLLVQPLALPYPFAFPKDVADSARKAKAGGRMSEYASQMCDVFSDPKLLGSGEFRDVDGVKLWPMAINVARAAYVYPDDVSVLWGEVFAVCNGRGGQGARGLGYSIAYVYAEGLVESLGLTHILEEAYKRNGCGSVNNVMDVAAAVIKARDVAADELHLAVETYSKKLAACVPLDSQQKYKASTLRGDRGVQLPKTGPSRAAERGRGN